VPTVGLVSTGDKFVVRSGGIPNVPGGHLFGHVSRVNVNDYSVVHGARHEHFSPDNRHVDRVLDRPVQVVLLGRIYRRVPSIAPATERHAGSGYRGSRYGHTTCSHQTPDTNSNC